MLNPRVLSFLGRFSARRRRLMFRISILSVAALVGLAACGPEFGDPMIVGDDYASDDLAEVRASTSPWDGTPEGEALLDFINDEATTADVLDFDVPLDRRAAGNIIAHRDGGDRLWGTTDDDIYNSVEEIDKVRFVGGRSLVRMVDYAAGLGLVPTDGDILGTYDGVTFSVEEAYATVDFINRVDHDVLDFELGLDARAVRSIVEARPVDTVQELAGLYYVGKSALNVLRDEVIDADLLKGLD
jgi:hypothetical protein